MQYSSIFNLTFIFFLFFCPIITAKEKWKLDKNLSTIKFELPVLFIKNVEGEFKEIDGFVELDVNNNNKAIFSVKIDSIEINYKKYKNLLLSSTFFDSKNFPIALVDTKKFSYKNENKLNFNVELIIKNTSRLTPISLEIIQLTEDMVQIKGDLIFSRKLFKIGLGKWSSGKILSDKAIIKTDLFLIKQ